ncbi:Nif3-like dinuclear metal center hexameric protein [Methanopyrus kandleri]
MRSSSKSVSVEDVLETLERLAPFDLAVEGDEVGLVAGDPSDSVDRVVVCLDLTPQLVRRLSPETLAISHHPVPEPLLERVRSPVIVFHSNWDVARAAEALAEWLGLEDVRKPDPLAAEGRFDGTLEDLLSKVEGALNPPEIRVVATKNHIHRVIVVSGFGLSTDRFVRLAAEEGADAVVSGDLTHRTAVVARVLGVTCVDATHAYTELPGLEELAGELSKHLQVRVELRPPEHPVGDHHRAFQRRAARGQDGS